MTSDVQHRIIRLSGVIILLFMILAGWQSYWHLAKSDWLLAQSTNRRMARVERNTPRGAIFDRQGRRLAWTEQGKRRYADPTATAAILGYIDPRYGRVGVEGVWNLELAGLSSRFDSRELHRVLHGEKPRGRDLSLTIDLTLQQEALDALRGKRGAVVILEPETGAILALATSPTFSAQAIGEHYAELSARKDGVLRNRATQDLYPPGSTMKVVTAAAALMHDLSPNTAYTCAGKTPLRGTTITDYHGTSHGTVAMPTALAQSCNYYFARIAVELGKQDFFETATAFGFNQRWWEKLPDPRMLPLAITMSSLDPDSSRSIPTGELAQMGFGQATVVATPLQMAMISAAIANDGTLMAPYLVQEVRDSQTNSTITTLSSAPIGFPMDAERAQELAAMMRKVVTSGTARRANSSKVTIAGKTGTAQQRGGDDHAWFIGFARTKGTTPKSIAFAVVVERGGTGGRIAVPVAAQVAERWAQLTE